MAQYFQVLSQTDKPAGEEIRQFYPTNIVDNQTTVQYVIGSNDQAFQGQQILVSSDQVMLVDGQPQQIIVDQSQVSFQNQQYVLQDANIEFQDTTGPQQIFYMEDSNNVQRVEAIPETQPAQPVVLNHQLQTSSIHAQLTANAAASPVKTVINTQRPITLSQLQQILLDSPFATVPPLVTPVQSEPHEMSENVAAILPQMSEHQTPPGATAETTPPKAPTPEPPKELPKLIPGKLAVCTHCGYLSEDFNKCMRCKRKLPEDVKAMNATEQQASGATPSKKAEGGKVGSEKRSAGTKTSNGKYKNPTVLVPQRQVQIPPARQPVVVQHQPRATSTPLPKMQHANQGTSTMQNPRGSAPAARHKPPLLRLQTSDVHPEKKCATSLNQHKPEGEKKKPNRAPNARARQPIKTVRPNAHNSVQHTVNHDSSTGQTRFPLAAPRAPRPVQRGPAPQQGVIHRPVGPQQQQHHYVIHNPNYIIQPQGNMQGASPHLGFPAFEPSSQLKQIIENTPIDDEYSDSIRMLVILSTGEQRLITFTLPKEQCTITEILEQVGLPIYGDTSIHCTETFMKEIHYIVHVGYAGDPPFATVPPLVTPVQSEPHEMSENVAAVLPQMSEHQTPPGATAETTPPKAPTPEPPKELPKLIPGKLAVCTHCGYLSEDFNKCMRCKRKLPEDVKAMNATEQQASGATPSKKAEGGKGGSEKRSAGTKTSNGTSTSSGLKSTPQSPTGKKRVTRSKVVEQEPIILTLSSDEEDDETKSMTTLKLNEQPSVLDEISRKEPTLSEYQLTDLNSKTYTKDETIPCVTTSIYCRTIRIGSYRFIPAEHNILVSTNEVVMKVPLPSNPQEMKTVKIEKSKMVKVLANFQKALPVIFYYVTPSMAVQIRNTLCMEKGTEFYFDPVSKEEAFKRITILPEHFGDEAKGIFKQIYGRPQSILEELNAKEANSILVKTCPKEVSKSLQSTLSTSFTEIKQLLIYPPGKGGLSINTEDYLCLAQDQFLNDVIIDFYLKYLVLQYPQEQQDKIHIFSTFFYKRLTTKPLKASRRMNPSEMDSNLTPAQKRHTRVKKWTKNVNIFDKDYIIIPINESCHWFLAIICFPCMEGCYTMDGKPYKLEPKQKQCPKKKLASLGGVTITQLKVEKEETAACDGDASDKDEAEGDDSELESEEETEEPKPGVVPPIKQPCVLIFDSLAGGASRSRVVATLRDYLSCEYRIKMNAEKTFNKDNIKCSCPKVPQQTNFTDCGLYLLQYVESFFATPISSYQFPIRELKTWFDEMTVTKKREDIAKLIEDLMIKYGKDPSILPEIQLPTLNGKLITKNEDEDVEEDEEEETMEEEATSESSTILPKTPDGDTTENIENESDEFRPSPSDGTDSSLDFIPKTPTTAVKSDGSDVKRSSNRETLSYLKAKRIVRHKNNEGSDAKKFKANDSM